MKMIKWAEDESIFDVPLAQFENPVRVQGAEKRSLGEDLLIDSARRYKLFTNGRDYLKFLEGNGHFKWARGEVSFVAGDTFLADGVGEYEVNGKCTFLVIRRA